MATPQQEQKRKRKRRQPWTSEENKKLFEYKIRNPNLSWPNIAMRAELNGRSGKSCRERWINHLNPEVSTGNFSQEEDNTIVHLQSIHGNSWAIIAKDPQLRGRTDNAIKNRWNNHLKKQGTSTLQNIPDPQLFHLNQNLPNASLIPTPISTSEEIYNPCFTEANLEVPWDELRSLIAGHGSLIPNVNPNETYFGGDYFEHGIFGPVSASQENEFMPTEQINYFRGDHFEHGIFGLVSASLENESMPTEQITTNWSP